MADRGLIKRFQDAWNGFVDKPAPDMNELAMADPLRLFPKNAFSQYNPDELITRKGYRTLDKMRNDDQVKACMAFKKLAVTATGYSVLSPDEFDEDWEITRFVEHQFKALPGTFTHCLYEILTAMDYGFSASEKVWMEIEDGEFAGKIGLKAIKSRKPHYLGFNQDEFGNIKYIQQFNTEFGFGKPTELPLYKFIIYSYMEEFDNPFGNSDLRAAYKWWWSKEHATNWLMMMLERFGIPPLIGLYDKDEFTGNDLSNLRTIFDRLQAATNVLLPGLNGPGPDNRSFELEFPEVAGQVSSVFEPALNRFDQAIARALLMPGLLGISPDQVSGSLARSKTSFDMFMLAQDFIRAEIEELVNEQIVRDLVDYNYNIDVYPVFSLNEIDNDVRLDLLKTWVELLNAGAVGMQDEDENHIRSLMDFPQSKIDDDADDADDIDDDMPPDENEFATFRQKNHFEGKCNFGLIQAFMESNESQAIESMRLLFEKAKIDIAAKIKRGGVNIKTLKGIREISTKAKIRKAMNDHLMITLTRGRMDLRKELKLSDDFADDGPNFTPPAAIAFLREKAINLASTANDAVIAAVKQALQKSIELGESTQAATARLNDAFKPFTGQPGIIKDGDQLEPHRLENIVRTESTAAYNQGRLVESRRKGVSDRMRGFEYSAILDSRTTPICMALDEKIFDFGDPELDTLRPPNHHNCRSVLVPITEFEDIDTREMISPSQIGRAKEMAGKGFV